MIHISFGMIYSYPVIFTCVPLGFLSATLILSSLSDDVKHSFQAATIKLASSFLSLSCTMRVSVMDRSNSHYHMMD